MTGQIAIVTDEPGWHGERLRKAFKTRGYGCQWVSLKECRFDLHANRDGLVIPGFEGTLPEGVFVRGIPGGTLEEVVFYLDILHVLRESGILVYNDARAIERTVDKAMTSFLLARAQIPTPPTWVTCRQEDLQSIVSREIALGNELVMKPLFGSQGQGLQRINAHNIEPDRDLCKGVFYLQRFIPTLENNCHDWRVFVVGGRAIVAMRRTSRHWVRNVASGGRCQATRLDKPLRELAEQAAAAVDVDHGGVDIIRDQIGRYWVVEVNGVPAWKGLQSTCDLNIAEILVDDFLRRRRNQVHMEMVG